MTLKTLFTLPHKSVVTLSIDEVYAVKCTGPKYAFEIEILDRKLCARE